MWIQRQLVFPHSTKIVLLSLTVEQPIADCAAVDDIDTVRVITADLVRDDTSVLTWDQAWFIFNIKMSLMI